MKLVPDEAAANAVENDKPEKVQTASECNCFNHPLPVNIDCQFDIFLLDPGNSKELVISRGQRRSDNLGLLLNLKSRFALGRVIPLIELDDFHFLDMNVNPETFVWLNILSAALAQNVNSDFRTAHNAVVCYLNKEGSVSA